MAFFRKPAPNHHQGITGLTKPAPMPPAAARAIAGEYDFKRALIIPALAFVAVGSLAFIALQQFSEPKTVTVYLKSPPEDPPTQVALSPAPQVAATVDPPRNLEIEAALQSILLNDKEELEVMLSSGSVELQAMINSGDLTIRTPSEVAELPQPVATPIAEPLAVANIEPVTAQVQPAPASVEVAAAQKVIEDVAVVDCFREVSALAAKSTLFFASGQDTIDANGLQTLREFGQEVQTCPNIMVHVTGHSDSAGTEEANMTMSWKRADAVVASLTQLGIDDAAFDPVGFGARSPLAQGDSGDDELNRRVEFHVLPKHAENP